MQDKEAASSNVDAVSEQLQFRSRRGPDYSFKQWTECAVENWQAPVKTHQRLREVCCGRADRWQMHSDVWTDKTAMLTVTGSC